MSRNSLPPHLRDVVSPAKPQSPDQNRKTFKDKLHAAVTDAEYAESQALRDAQMQDKKSLSIAMLIDGRPQAFVDFFHLTHFPGGRAEQQEELPQNSLLFLKTQLVKADIARQSHQVEEVYGAYKLLAKYFAQLGRLQTAEFFFKQCLHFSREAAWLPGELESNLALGVLYEELHDTPAAIACHERRLELAGKHELQAEIETAHHSLTSVYLDQAEALEKAGRLEEAMEAFNKCLRAAGHARDSAHAALANYRLGLLSHQQAKWQDAMFYLRRFLDLASSGATSGGDKGAEGVATTTLAHCLQEVGNTQGAIQCLEDYLETAARGPEQSGPAVASCSLGILYYAQGAFPRAVSLFERFFEVARGLPDKRMADVARINLGVARAAVNSQAYMNMVNTDLGRLIAWKNRRVPPPQLEH
ncbi:subunit of axonemal inner dynein [Haematococcus lacustris]